MYGCTVALVYECTYVCMCVGYVCMYVCIEYVCMYVRTIALVYARMSVCVKVCMYVCMYVCTVALSYVRPGLCLYV
jgi:hypothetical protein